MATEVELVVYFQEGSEPPDKDEIEAALQQRYPDAYIVEYDEEDA
jgi:hypothetical protein